MGAFLMAREVLPSMLERKCGTILFIGATASRRGAGAAAFASAKGAQRLLAESMARAYGPKGVHVALMVIDAVVDEPLMRQRLPGRPDEFFCRPDDIAATAISLTRQSPSAWTFELEVRHQAKSGSSPMSLEVVPVRAFKDNYIWLLHDTATNLTAAVDPGEPMPVLTTLLERGWHLDWILNTHHHWDHTGANLALKEARRKYIARIDPDDFWEKEKLEKQFNFLENNSHQMYCENICLEFLFMTICIWYFCFYFKLKAILDIFYTC